MYDKIVTCFNDAFIKNERIIISCYGYEGNADGDSVNEFSENSHA